MFEYISSPFFIKVGAQNSISVSSWPVFLQSIHPGREMSKINVQRAEQTLWYDIF